MKKTTKNHKELYTRTKKMFEDKRKELHKMHNKYEDEFNKRVINHIVYLSIIIGILFIISLNGALNIESINEDAFCNDKINTWFPEYDIKFVTYKSFPEPHCNADIISKSDVIQRDGLKVITNNNIENRLFYLQNKTEIERLKNDTKKNVFIIITIIAFIIEVGLIILLIERFLF